MKRMISILLAATLLLTGCSKEPTEEEQFLSEVRAEQNKLGFLSNCLAAVYSLQSMFGMWNSNTYLEAKNKSHLSSALAAEWFPSVNWLGSDITNQKKAADIRDIAISSVSEKEQEGIIRVTVTNTVTNAMKTYVYTFRYSVHNDEITSLEELVSY